MRRLEFNPRRVLARRRAAPDATEGVDAGFTLIELMVVLLIMAILLAIAIPTFLGVKYSAQDRAAQSNLVNASISIKALFAQGGYYPQSPSMVAAANMSEPELSFTTAGVVSSPADHVSLVVSPDGQIVVLTDMSADGRCWFAEVNEEQTQTSDGGWEFGVTPDQGVYYGVSTNVRATCAASLIGGLTIFSGWSATFPA